MTRSRLLAEGLDDSLIDRWLVDGRLRRVHWGVYAVGHEAPSWQSDLMAAVLACGDGARASHWSAGYAFRVLRTRPRTPHVTVPTTGSRRRPGIAVHRVKELHPLDVATWHGIPITTVPRLLLDLAPRLTAPELTRACHEAWIHHGTAPRAVEACIARNPGKKGVDNLRRAHGADVTLSALEDGFLGLLDTHALPRPRTNIDQHGDKVDCHWPEHDLTVELMSFRYHGTRQAFEADIARRRRSNHVAYSWGDVFERGAQTAAEMARALDEIAGRPPTPPTGRR